MKNRQIIAVLLSMILFISLCLPFGSSVLAAETYSEEKAESVDEGSTEAAAEEEAIAEESEEEEIASTQEEAIAEESEEEEIAAEEEKEPAAEEEAIAEESEEEEIAAEEEKKPAAATAEKEPAEESEKDLADEEAVIIEEAEELEYQPKDTKSADDLFAGYVDMEFGIGEIVKPDFGKKRTTAGSKLKADTLLAYTRVSGQLPLLAAGEITSTVFTISGEDLGFTKVRWSAEELGVTAIVQNGRLTQEAKDAASARLTEEYFNLSLLIDALLADHPYLLYWYDKTQTTRASGHRYAAVRVNGVYYLTFTGDLILEFPVAEAYSAGEYTVDTSVGQTVQESAENAQGIVAECGSLSDYEKLTAYRQAICDLTSYNYPAIASHEAYGNPWQLIWVFDGDPATSVVCEGYSKAFKYLCDQSSFDSDIDCKAVTGLMNSGEHMWNVVTMEDERNYLVDVTNCDAGMVGADDQLFLIGTHGSPQDGYRFTLVSQNTIFYAYDADTKAIWSTEELTLSSFNYPPSVENAVVSGIEDRIYNGEAQTQQIVVEYDGKVLTEGTDYTVSYWDNTDVGTARVIITGAGYYVGSIEREFAIEKADQVLFASSEKIVNGKAANVTVTGAQGDLTYVFADNRIAQITSDDGAGHIKIKGTSAGTTVLTITSEETEFFKEAVFELEIRVVPGASTHVEFTNVASGIKVSWNAVAGAKYYKVYRGTEHLFTTSKLCGADTAVKLLNGQKFTYKVVASTTKDSDAGDSTVYRTGTGYRLMTVGIVSLTNTVPGKMTVTYGKNPACDKYAVRYGLKEDMSDARLLSVQGADNLSKTVSVLQGKMYYVQVRCYKIVDGKNYYSGFCTTKKLTIKK